MEKDYLFLRNRQNRQYAEETTLRGITASKSDNPSSCLPLYNHALEIDPLFTDAFVARGAYYANHGKYKEALLDFKKALKIDSKHENARIYYKQTKEKLLEIEKELNEKFKKLWKENLLW